MGSSMNKMERSLESPSGVDGLGHDMEALDLENEPVLTLLPADDGAREMCGSVVVVQRAVERALPAGCVVAKIQQDERSGAIRVRLGFRDVAATAALRDAVVLEDGAFEQKLNAALPQWRRPATDDELVELGCERLASGREFFVNPNEAQLERPTVPVPASARPATNDELSGLGYETLAAASGREIYVRLFDKRLRAALSVPDAYVCPITRELMHDPVFASDGHTYERDAIQQWLISHDTSPKTGLILDSKHLVPNFATASASTIASRSRVPTRASRRGCARRCRGRSAREPSHVATTPTRSPSSKPAQFHCSKQCAALAASTRAERPRTRRCSVFASERLLSRPSLGRTSKISQKA